MKIASSNIQFFTEYSRRDSERNGAFLSANTQSSPTQNQPNSNSRNALVRQIETDERVSLNSRNSINTYSSSTVKMQGEEAAKQITTQKAVSSMLNRFYEQKVRLTAIELTPEAQQRTLNGLNQKQNFNKIDTQPSQNNNNNFTISAGDYYEFQTSQSLAFVARGEINTTDGKTIQFEFYANAQQDFEYRKGSGVYAEQVTQRTDPLVINLDGNYNNLSSGAFEFDLDNDGEKENLSFAGKGSGFLALDKNGDGKINNGSELFGPETGNGFAELADYDEDGNGFIDEGDAAYNNLKVWTKDENGNDKLLSLKEADVAAIGVESGFSPFDVKDNYNNELGQVQRTGIFVRESGEVGSVQQINLTSRDLEAEQAFKENFDRSESQNATTRENTTNDNGSAIGIGSIDLEKLENVMQRLDSVTQAMLDRQDELAEMDDSDAPKSLLQQLVNKLEETRLEQEEKRNTQTEKDTEKDN